MKKFKHSRGIVIGLMFFALIALATVLLITSAAKSVTQEQADLLRSSLYTAAVNCYSVTGRYPTLEELKADYGVVVDEESFDVYYDAFASNILPDIRVQVKEVYD